jgi:hypothetical protein
MPRRRHAPADLASSLKRDSRGALFQCRGVFASRHAAGGPIRAHSDCANGTTPQMDKTTTCLGSPVVLTKSDGSGYGRRGSGSPSCKPAFSDGQRGGFVNSVVRPSTVQQVLHLPPVDSIVDDHHQRPVIISGHTNATHAAPSPSAGPWSCPIYIYVAPTSEPAANNCESAVHARSRAKRAYPKCSASPLFEMPANFEKDL